MSHRRIISLSIHRHIISSLSSLSSQRLHRQRRLLDGNREVAAPWFQRGKLILNWIEVSSITNVSNEIKFENHELKDWGPYNNRKMKILGCFGRKINWIKEKWGVMGVIVLEYKGVIIILGMHFKLYGHTSFYITSTFIKKKFKISLKVISDFLVIIHQVNIEIINFWYKWVFW